MKKLLLIVMAQLVSFCTPLMSGVSAQSESRYYAKASANAANPDADGFLRRWTVLEPISKPNHTNIVFTDSYLRETFAKEYFKGQATCVPKDGEKVKAICETVDMPKDFRRVDPSTLKHYFTKETLRWHKLDSKTYNLKLMRFGEEKKQRLYGVIYWVVTVVDCEEDLNDIRLSVGSNSASMWWIDGEEVLLMSGDRRMVADDATSHRLTLKKGIHVLRGAIINGPGMSDFCVRLMNAEGKPVTKGFTCK